VKRTHMLQALAKRIVTLPSAHPVRIAIDGIDAAGKTTLANELAMVLQSQGRTVIRASIDGFHRPRAERYQRGPASAEGYYADSFDYPALRDELLLPLGPTGSRLYRRAVFDFRTDVALIAAEERAPADAVLLLDGVFLLRPELDGLWEYRIFVDVPFAIALHRAMQRDLTLFGSAEAVQARYHERYIPGQRLYFEHVRPQRRADVIVANEDPGDPRLTFQSDA
jgi:uridine kinase